MADLISNNNVGEAKQVEETQLLLTRNSPLTEIEGDTEVQIIWPEKSATASRERTIEGADDQADFRKREELQEEEERGMDQHIEGELERQIAESMEEEEIAKQISEYIGEGAMEKQMAEFIKDGARTHPDHASIAATARGGEGETLCCSVCHGAPGARPFLGCPQLHYICAKCRDAGGVLLSCPKCKSSDITVWLAAAEREFFGVQILEEAAGCGEMVSCCFAVNGCAFRSRLSQQAKHEQRCEYRLVRCPKWLFSRSCPASLPALAIKEHGRKEHNLHQGYTQVAAGRLSSKMFDKGPGKQSCTYDKESARFSPLELEVEGNLFYVYYERRACRALWFFFVRMYDTEEAADRFECELSVGSGSLTRGEESRAERSARCPVVPYHLTRVEIHESGCCLVIDDATMRVFKFENVLFRLWARVYKRPDPESAYD